MEMDYKQWIVDFVNQSLLQLSTCDVESKRYERTEFAEHLGEMNRQWHRMHGTLNRKVCSCVTVCMILAFAKCHFLKNVKSYSYG